MKGKKGKNSDFDIGWLDLIEKGKKEYYIEKWENNLLLKQDVKIEAKAKGTIWNDILSFQYSEPRETESISFISNQKPENLLRRIIQSSTDQNDIVLDCFMGSGTTISVSKKLNRKFIGIEMGDFFDNTYIDVQEIKKKKEEIDDEHIDEKDLNIKDLTKNLNKKAIVGIKVETEKKIKYYVKKLGLLGRLKNVLSGDKKFSSIVSLVEREPHLTKDINWQGGGFFKYYELEQYEDTLNKMKYKNEAKVSFEDDIYNQYIFFSDKKLTDFIEVNEKDIKINFDSLYENIDLPETISLALGESIKKITKDEVVLEKTGLVKYNIKKMNNDEKKKLLSIIKEFIWWGK